MLAHDIAARGGAERVAVEAATVLRDQGFAVALVTLGSDCGNDELGDYFGLDLTGVRIHALRLRGSFGLGAEAIRRIAGLARTSARLRAMRADVFVNCAFRSEVPGVARCNVYYVHFPHELHVPSRGLVHRAYLGAVGAMQRLGVNHGPRFLDTYDVILANSHFTAGQVEANWHRESIVVYPPCDAIDPGPAERRPWIVSVGRFQDYEPGRPHKRQDVLIQAFAEMVDLHTQGWSLHLAGSVGSNAELQRLRALAEGLPVVFHPNATKPELAGLYRQSSLYWHAQGYGETAPVAQEHFGITVVEAMSAGLIPLVYADGGQREIVEPVVASLLWSMPNELAASTRALASCSAADQGKLRSECSVRSKQFSADRFKISLTEFIHRSGLDVDLHQAKDSVYVVSDSEAGESSNPFAVESLNPGDRSRVLSRALIVTGRYPGRGGVETAVTNLTYAFRESGIAAEVVTILPGPQLVSAVQSLVVFDRRVSLQESSVTGNRKWTTRSLARLPLLVVKRWDRSRGLRALRQVIINQPVGTLVIATSPRVASYLRDAGVLSDNARPPVVVQYHLPFNAQVDLEGPGLPLSRSISADAFVALSTEDAERFEAALSIPCYRIPNPLPPQSASLAMKLKGQRNSATSAGKRVVALCRLSAEKQLDLMIRLFLEATNYPGLSEWRLDIYGDGPERGVLEALIASVRDGSRRVHLRGWSDDISSALDGAQLILSTSKFEGAPVSILEAAQIGVPALAFASSAGVKESVQALGGVLVDAEDRAGFVAHLRELLSDPVTLARMGDTARKKSSNFDSRVAVRHWVELTSRLHSPCT